MTSPLVSVRASPPSIRTPELFAWEPTRRQEARADATVAAGQTVTVVFSGGGASSRAQFGLGIEPVPPVLGCPVEQRHRAMHEPGEQQRLRAVETPGTKWSLGLFCNVEEI